MRSCTVAGHICVDLIPALRGSEAVVPGTLVEIGALTLRPGGCVANTAQALAALGAPVRIVADAGEDELGAALVAKLEGQAGIDTSGLRLVPGASTSYSLVFERAGGDRAFWHHVGANDGFDGRRVTVDGIDLLHVGYPTILPALSAGGGRLLLDLLARVRGGGATTSVDLATVDPESPAARIDWRALLAAALPLTDLLSPSVDDLTSALHVPRPRDRREVVALGRQMLELGTAVLLLTDGPNGLHLLTAVAERMASGGSCLASRSADWADRELYVPARATEVVSTTGAGDAASAGLLYGVLAGLGAEASASLAADAAAMRVKGCDRLPPYPRLSGRS